MFSWINICKNLCSSPKRSSCVTVNKSKVTLSGSSYWLLWNLRNLASKCQDLKKTECWSLDLFSLVLMNWFIPIIITISSCVEIATFLFKAKWKLGWIKKLELSYSKWSKTLNISTVLRMKRSLILMLNSLNPVLVLPGKSTQVL